MSYAVIWREDDGPLYAGKLEFADTHLLLCGSASSGRESDQKLFYDEFADARIERRPDARLAGRPTLVLERSGGTRLRVGSLTGCGAIHELADRLLAARGKAAA
jgi:hypothetical protein